jgi:hypothetical protein
LVIAVRVAVRARWLQIIPAGKCFAVIVVLLLMKVSNKLDLNGVHFLKKSMRTEVEPGYRLLLQCMIWALLP